MAVPRELSLVRCSCGGRWGDLRRIESPDEDVADAELTRLRDKVPVIVEHWRMRHSFTIHPRAPLSVAAAIEKAAREMAAENNPQRDGDGQPLLVADDE